MSSIVLQVAKADFFERIRRSHFLLTIFMTVVLAYVFSPPRNGGYVTLVFGENYVGLFNSAWMGTSVAISVTVFFSLIGYYVISNAIQTDLQNNVSEIIAASSLHRAKYLLGKFFSSFAILTVIVMITMITAIIMQLVRGEDYQVNLLDYLGPFVLLVLPGMAVIAAIAVVFEITPFLHSTIGNILYFVLWLVTIFSGFKPIQVGNLVTISDLFGHGIAYNDIIATLKEKFPKYNGSLSNGLTMLEQKAELFIWQGVDWNFASIAGRSLWIIVAIFLVLFASLFFSRFNYNKTQSSKSKNPQIKPQQLDNKMTSSLATFSATSLSPVKKQSSILPILIAELKLMFSGLRWWLFVAIGLVALSFILPLDTVKTFVWPVIWVWPLALWSAMGNRESKFRTEELIFPSPNILTKLLPISWLSGVVVSVLISSGVAVRFILEGEITGLFVWFTGALFVPTLALTCGILVENNKLFEVLYLSLWYMGPLNDFPMLNFMDANSSSTALIFLTITVSLLVVAFMLTKKKLYR